MFKFLVAAAMLIPAFAFADSVIMRDGSQFRGTFLQGTSRSVTIIDNSGARRTFSVRDIQQIMFGDSNYSSNPNAYGAPVGSFIAEPPVLVSRLRQDVADAMNNTNLPDPQYRRLQDATEVLRQAAENRSYVFDVNAREVRLALDNVVAVFNTPAFSPPDRQRVLEDIRQLRQVRPDLRNGPTNNNRNLDSNRYNN